MLDIGTILRHYKREDVRKEMIRCSVGREVAVRFSYGFGKRPDILKYPQDVLEFAKSRATSFHVSEERWQNPLLLSPGMRQKEMDDLRIGWDLILDIDIPDWRLSKIVSWLLIKSLKDNGIRSVSCKFSGNKGFHIGVPFEAFPPEFDGRKTSDLFPEACKNISLYLIKHVQDNYSELTDNNEVVLGGKYSFSLKYLSEVLGKPESELCNYHCAGCRKVVDPPEEDKYEFLCPKCGNSMKLDLDYATCDRCGNLMERKLLSTRKTCSCGSSETFRAFNPLSIIEVDTILISSRHMYRLVYSLHEKSGLCSLPIDPDSILYFKKDMANPNGLVVGRHSFLDTADTSCSEGAMLLKKAYEQSPLTRTSDTEDMQFSSKREITIEEIENAIPGELFPPCIQNILAGLEDGRKRALFILINFLSSTGYGWDGIEDILKEWNLKNHEPLRDVLLKGQQRYRKGKKRILPPNCSNKAYYMDLGICRPDGLCRKIKNPVNYAILKSKIANKKKPGRKKLTKEQKEMRRRFRMKRSSENTST